ARQEGTFDRASGGRTKRSIVAIAGLSTADHDLPKKTPGTTERRPPRAAGIVSTLGAAITSPLSRTEMMSAS
ncbi:MAG TPA: hypothetical protein VHN13_18025, partial [Candidatus Tectomicrobia bacterium]|nr:hypothetical protein [Candidatus Tectomicrobia bacterium]